MKRKTASLSLIVSILFLVVTFIHVTYSYAEKNFLWRVQSKRSTVYLLGSVHLLKKDVYPLSRTIESAFEKSDALAVEADINDISRLDIQKLMSSAFYSGDDTLEKHVSRDTFDAVKDQAERLGLPVEFAKAAGKKKILELESLDYQIDLLSGLDDTEQELFLLYTLKDLKILVQEVDKLVDAWKSGAAESMESTITRSFTEDRKFYPIYEKLIYKRNRNMTLKIEGFLRTSGTYFVVVGAAHLLGDRGIIQLLKEKGFNVEQL